MKKKYIISFFAFMFCLHAFAQPENQPSAQLTPLFTGSDFTIVGGTNQFIPGIWNNHSVRFFPNPVMTTAHLVIEPIDGETYVLTVFDSKGQQVSVQNIYNNHLQIDGKLFSAGAYYFEIKDELGNQLYANKFLVIK